MIFPVDVKRESKYSATSLGQWHEETVRAERNEPARKSQQLRGAVGRQRVRDYATAEDARF